MFGVVLVGRSEMIAADNFTVVGDKLTQSTLDLAPYTNQPESQHGAALPLTCCLFVTSAFSNPQDKLQFHMSSHDGSWPLIATLDSTCPSVQVTLPTGTASLAVNFQGPASNTSLERSPSEVMRRELTRRIQNLVFEGQMVGRTGIPECPVEKLEQGGCRLGCFQRQVQETLLVLSANTQNHTELCHVLTNEWQPAVTQYLGWVQLMYIDPVQAEDLRPERRRLNAIASQVEELLAKTISQIPASADQDQ
eukprot:TRINITY_DN15703_c0_g1_i1.p1 TRINITY_DN15703_c0_g1~~TRINITY_DN15703_c0_g1_i1.p1  ORF type:complete len:250 (-),score=48.60 TRINITY_DN15703_c0_g1_i1:601-1350(-)